MEGPVKCRTEVEVDCRSNMVERKSKAIRNKTIGNMSTRFEYTSCKHVCMDRCVDDPVHGERSKWDGHFRAISLFGCHMVPRI